MKTKNEPTHGGNRVGAGRKKGEPKKALGVRVPVKHFKHLTELVRKEVKRLAGN